MATLQLAPGYQNYLAFLATTELEDTDVPVTAKEAGIVSHDEDDYDVEPRNSPPCCPPTKKKCPIHPHGKHHKLKLSLT